MDNEITESNLSIIELPTTVNKIVDGMDVFDDLKQKLLKPVDKQDIASKQYIKRSGWRKLAFAFNISDEIVKAEKDYHESIDGVFKTGPFTWRIWVKVTAPNGRTVTGIGSCSSNERNFAHVEHDVYATAHTRAKNRAISDILGSGEVSAEEMGEKTIFTKYSKPKTDSPNNESELKKFDNAAKAEPKYTKVWPEKKE